MSSDKNYLTSSSAIPWPRKDVREQFEIDRFVEHYAKLPRAYARQFKKIFRNERPDWIVKDIATNEEFGVELTSVYLDDRSVPDRHMTSKMDGCARIIPYDSAELRQYSERIISTIEGKISKAKNGYDLSRPLILSIYLNEYIGIFLDQEAINELVRCNAVLFDNMKPFSEILLWELPNHVSCLVRPGK